MALFNSLGVKSTSHSGISKRSALRYAFMPEVMPRVRRLGGVMASFAFMLAQVYASARLLSPMHPMLNSANIGRYGVRDVIAQAANNLVLKKENTDQILIFCAVLLAAIMIIVQAFIIAIYAFISTASAQGGGSPSGGNFFTTPGNPTDDVVLTFLQKTLGVKGLFNNAEPIGFSVAIAEAFHKMLGTYSMAMMVIAVIIVIYYVITVVGESAQSGTPFGRRFNGLWAPIRLVLALGLLVPLGNGLNAAQYAAMYTAKFGSGLASNAWATFSTALKNEKNYAMPGSVRSINNLAKDMVLFETCTAAYNKMPGNSGMAFSSKASPTEETVNAVDLNGNIVMGGSTPTTVQLTEKYHYFTWSKGSGQVIGDYGFDCGKMTIGLMPRTGANAKYATIIEKVEEAYINAITTLQSSLASAKIGERFAKYAIPGDKEAYQKNKSGLPTTSEIQEIINTVDQQLAQQIETIFSSTSSGGASGGSEVAQAIISELKLDNLDKNGWGNAGTYYLRLAYAGQKAQNILQQLYPTVSERYDVIETVTRAGQNARNASYGERTWNRWFGTNLNKLGKQSEHIINALNIAHTTTVVNLPDRTEPNVPGRNYLSSSWQDDSWGIKIIKNIFAIGSLQKLYDGTANNVFPMLLLNNIGHDIIVRAMYALVGGAAVSVIPKIGGLASGFVFLFGFVGIGIGFVLCYVLPLMPFIYFFFAIVEWVMGIVEALVGAPLWALSHLKIEGDGLPGPGAMNGYMILFGILVRPILILFGLIIGFIMFNSGAYFLNLIYGGAVQVFDNSNDSVGVFSMIAYLLLYAVMCYNLGLTCFKLIDTIPQQVMRWMGQSNLHFNDNKPDPIGNTTAIATTAGGLIGQQSGSILSGGLKNILGKQ